MSELKEALERSLSRINGQTVNLSWDESRLNDLKRTESEMPHISQYETHAKDLGTDLEKLKQFRNNIWKMTPVLAKYIYTKIPGSEMTPQDFSNKVSEEFFQRYHQEGLEKVKEPDPGKFTDEQNHIVSALESRFAEKHPVGHYDDKDVDDFKKEVTSNYKGWHDNEIRSETRKRRDGKFNIRNVKGDQPYESLGHFLNKAGRGELESVKKRSQSI